MTKFETKIRNYYDIEQYLKRFGIYIYLGKRLWDLEMTGVEIKSLHRNGLISDALYTQMKIVLHHEHELELKRTQTIKEENKDHGR